LPQDELLASELTAPMYKYDAQNAILLERKEDMKKRGSPSPDIADAFVLTFAYPVSSSVNDEWDGHEENDQGRSSVTGY
jgi:hypothetical protein